MSFWVHRVREPDPENNDPGGEGWVGPLPSRGRADREAAAWESVGWAARVVPSTPEVRARVRAWQRAVVAARPEFYRVRR